MQKKLALTLDDLQVESFTTEKAPRRTGTVYANQTEANTCANTCWAFDSCAAGGCGTEDTCSLETFGVACGTETMNDLNSQCNAASMAGPTCEGVYGYTCGNLCTAPANGC